VYRIRVASPARSFPTYFLAKIPRINSMHPTCNLTHGPFLNTQPNSVNLKSEVRHVICGVITPVWFDRLYWKAYSCSASIQNFSASIELEGIHKRASLRLQSVLKSVFNYDMLKCSWTSRIFFHSFGIQSFNRLGLAADVFMQNSSIHKLCV
jgi:hypothetical protein